MTSPPERQSVRYVIPDLRSVNFRDRHVDRHLLETLLPYAQYDRLDLPTQAALRDAARNITLTEQEQVDLARCGYSSVRKALAANPRLTITAAERLLGDDSPRVLRNLHKRKAVTDEQRRRIVERLHALSNTELDPVIAQFGDDPDYAVRCTAGMSTMAITGAVQNANLQPHHLAEMLHNLTAHLRDANRHVHPEYRSEEIALLLRHPKMTAELIESVAQRPEASMRAVAAAAPTISLDLLCVLAIDPDASVRAAARTNVHYGDVPEETQAHAYLMG